MNNLIQCPRCGDLYNEAWKCACPTMCQVKTPEQKKLKELERRLEVLERMHAHCK